jgi:hypothetical protein
MTEIPILEVLDEIMNHIPMNTVIHDIILSDDGENNMIRGMSVFTEDWRVSHNALQVGDKVFNINTVKAILVLK